MEKNSLKINSDFNLQHQLRKIATEESIKYVEKNMKNCLCFSHNKNILFDYALPKINHEGLILEFGVRKGLTIKEISKRIGSRKCHGFDSFEGLPEDWSGQQYPKGAYSENGKIPLYGGIISSSVMILGMISLGSLFGAKGIAITHLISYSSLFFFLYSKNFLDPAKILTCLLEYELTP